MRIVSWNIRAGGGKRINGIQAQLLDWQPDIIGLAEFRGTAASQWLAVELAEAGFCYQLTSTNAKLPAQNALLLASKVPLQAISTPRMPGSKTRWLLARVATQPGLVLGMMHIPNHNVPALKYPFMAALLKMVETWKLGPGLLIGDSNCSNRDLDEENPLGPRFHREHDWIVGMEQRGWHRMPSATYMAISGNTVGTRIVITGFGLTRLSAAPNWYPPLPDFDMPGELIQNNPTGVRV